MMLEAKQVDRVIRKMERFCGMLERRVFVKAAEISMNRFETAERFHRVPDEKFFTAFSPGESWGGEGRFCWERGTFTPGGSRMAVKFSTLRAGRHLPPVRFLILISFRG